MDIHSRGKEIAQRLHRSGFDMMEFLIELERTKAYKDLRHPDALTYAMKEFDLTYNSARSFLRISRKSVELPELREALKEKRVTVSKCEKVAAKLTKENIVQVIEHLEKHSAEKTLNWLGRDEEQKMNLKIALRIVDMLRHGQSLTKEKVDLESMIELSIREYIDHHDPVKKAERAGERKAKKARGISRTPKKRQYPAALKHALNGRDKRRCIFHDKNNERCEHKKFTDFHHIIEVHNGGPDTEENMITLCTAHHKIVHEQQIPRSTQREWQKIVRDIPHELSP